MKEGYLIEGHRSKSGFELEDTLILDDQHLYPNEKDASVKAREYFEKDGNLDLVVIYRSGEPGGKVGVRFLFRDKEGHLGEVDSWWNSNFNACW
jgi:hypothetical protein